MYNERYVYVVVRKDMSPEMQMVQSCHATLEVGFKSESYKVVTNLVLFEIDNEKDLIDCSVKLQLEELDYEMFFEPDNQLGYTALATLPTYERRIKAFNGLKLWTQTMS